MTEKHPDTKHEGGPGASHENKKEPPHKSRPHGELNKHDPVQGNTKRNSTGKSGGDGREHTDAGSRLAPLRREQSASAVTKLARGSSRLICAKILALLVSPCGLIAC